MTPQLNAKVEALRVKLEKLPVSEKYIAEEILALLEIIISKREEEEAELIERLDALINFIH